MIKPLSAKQLRPQCIAADLPFKTSAELADLPGILGQDRALQAVEFGIGVHHRGFNLYVMGPSGLGKHGIMRKYLNRRASHEETPSDWCYVRDFDQDYRPRALKLPAGQGKSFRKDMKNLVEDLGTAINAAFEASEYQEQVQSIERLFNKKQASLIDKHVEKARLQNIQLSTTPTGFILTPIIDGKIVSEEEFENLADEKRLDIEEKMALFQDELDYLVPEISRQRREFNIKMKKLNRKVALFATNNLIKDVKRRYKALPEVVNYLKGVQEDVLHHLDAFSENDEEESNAEGNVTHSRSSDDLQRYQVNLIVDSGRKMAPRSYTWITQLTTI